MTTTTIAEVIMIQPLVKSVNQNIPMRIIYGSGPPTNDIGNNGDSYRNIDNDDWFGPKANGVWPASYSMRGPPGKLEDADRALVLNAQTLSTQSAAGAASSASSAKTSADSAQASAIAAARSAPMTFPTNLASWAASNAYPSTSNYVVTNGVVTRMNVVWPDGATGTWTADVVSTAFPDEVDAWHVTYVGSDGVTRTVMQPKMTRDSTTGLITNQPALVIS